MSPTSYQAAPPRVRDADVSYETRSVKVTWQLSRLFETSGFRPSAPPSAPRSLTPKPRRSVPARLRAAPNQSRKLRTKSKSAAVEAPKAALAPLTRARLKVRPVRLSVRFRRGNTECEIATCAFFLKVPSGAVVPIPSLAKHRGDLVGRFPAVVDRSPHSLEASRPGLVQ